MDPRLRQLIDQGVAAHRAGQTAVAERFYREVLLHEPRSAGVIQLMGLLHHQSGRYAEAAGLIRLAISLGGDVPQFSFNLGNVLRAAGDLDGAASAFADAISLKPDYLEAIDNLAGIRTSQSLYDEALKLCEKSLALRPGGREAMVNQARCFHDLGMIAEATRMLLNVLAADPGNADVHSNLVACSYSDPDASPDEILAGHLRYVERHCAPLARKIRAHSNVRDPDRRLRLAYLSGDLRSHPVGRFMDPILREHDRGRFEIYCYCDAPAVDEVTRRLMASANQWRMVAGLTADKLAELIRADQIDILVDLAGHTTGNRLLVFAQKPAPVQVTYLGQTATTGLPTMDYLITTPLIHPPGAAPNCCTEQLVRLRSFSCWEAPDPSPEPNDPPSASTGRITFLSTNSTAKINHRVLETWAGILNAVPESKLLMRVGLGQVNTAFARRVVQCGVPAGRFALESTAPRESFLEIYHRADIGLDPFPYNGYTTTHEALWMGVPVVSLAGKVLGPSRYGVSLLNAVGLDDLVAEGPGQYIEIATRLAQDLPKLRMLRSTLRQRLGASPLMNAVQVTRDLEDSYRVMWRKWCESATG